MQSFSKNIDNCLSMAKFKYLTFDPLSGAKKVVYNFDTAMLICSEELLNIIALRKFDESL